MIKLDELNTRKQKIEEAIEVVSLLMSLDYTKLLNKSSKMPLWNRSNLKDFLSGADISMSCDSLFNDKIYAQTFFFWKETPTTDGRSYRKRLEVKIYNNSSEKGLFFLIDGESRVAVDKDAMIEKHDALRNELDRIKGLIDNYSSYKASVESIVAQFNAAMKELPSEFQESIR